MVVAALVMFGGVFATAVHTAQHRAHTTAYRTHQVTAVIRPTVKERIRQSNADSSVTKQYLSLDDYTSYLMGLQQAGIQPQYSMSVSMPMRQTGAAKAIAGKADRDAQSTGGEYTLYGLYDSHSEDVNIPGKFRVTQGKGLDYKSKKGKSALVSEAFARKNNLKPGSKFSVANPNDAAKTYAFTVRGVYAYTDPAPKGMGGDARLAKNNRANAIYVGPYAFADNKLNDDSAIGWAVARFDVGFRFNSPDEYQMFTQLISSRKLAKGYRMSTPDLDRYVASLKPLDRFDARMRRMSIGLYAMCGALALALVALSLCGRRDEIAMDMVIGVVRGRIGWQFALETLMPSLPGLLVGGVASAFASKPLGAALVGGNAARVGSACFKPMWYCLGFVALLATMAFMRAIVARIDPVFDVRQGGLGGSDTDASESKTDADRDAGTDTTDGTETSEEAEA
ncbi:ABC transporter permease [Bifidobacterium sp. ESL0763]|uniref:ABC transporter permease n=1 Tax=Bifidobacterium sp. ESL0763 TaxID=2983227 RepID=UPI0023F808FD|nr:ABC transporter permease [Bifidobacterium sp. ESL0763]MDF7664427.1 ABC transporter permease [Bifidobacterium sp. ESL0763]